LQGEIIVVITVEEKEEFARACEEIYNKERERKQIGTLSEKTVHAVLKKYLVPYEKCHEIKCGRYIADIFCEGEITEIQTAGFDKLRKKLELFLKDYEVTVVYPIPATKWLFWMNEETGEIIDKRKSPKKGTRYDCFKELYKIKFFLKEPKFHLRLILMDVEEYRLLNGWSTDGKKGSHRYDRIPISLVEDIFINKMEDYVIFVPEKIPEEFTSKDYRKETKLTMKNAQIALNILNYLEIIERIGKSGRSYLYKRKK
jgi:hypothetical protein